MLGSIIKTATSVVGFDKAADVLKDGLFDFAKQNLNLLGGALDLVGNLDAKLGGGGFLGAGAPFDLATSGFLPRPSEIVGHKVKSGSRFSFFNPEGDLRMGRISKRQYKASFSHPVQLPGDKIAFGGRLFGSMADARLDAMDGRSDGRLSVPFPDNDQFMNTMNGIFDGGGGAGEGLPQISPNMSLEDKLAVLMARLSKHLDEQIDEKMSEIERAMQQQQNGASAGSSGSSGSGQPNLQLMQTQLQQLLQKRQQMFQTMSSILKSLHDTSLTTIRHLKA